MPYYDRRETRPPQEREAELLARLPGQIAHAKTNAPAYTALLADVNPADVHSRQALAQLPITRKSALLAQQKAQRPFGGYAAVSWGPQCLRVFASPGPIYEPEGAHPDYYRAARALHAAGFRRGDLVHNTFSYHFTPAGAITETAAHALGCTVFPAGVGQTEMQVGAIADLRPNAYTGTPSFLRILLDKARGMGVQTAFTKALVSGEAFTASQRTALAEDGVTAYQAYATADVGLIAYETPAREGLIVDEDILVEIVRPGTGEPVAEGEVGEVIVTTFNPTYPLIRFATGDLSAVLPGTSPCGRSNMRLKGWMGRADQTTKIRGMFVHPAQVAQVVQRHPEIRQARLVVSGKPGEDHTTLHAVFAPGITPDTPAVVASLRDVTKLRVDVLAVDALPNDGKVIDDAREYDL